MLKWVFLLPLIVASTTAEEEDGANTSIDSGLESATEEEALEAQVDWLREVFNASDSDN